MLVGHPPSDFPTPDTSEKVFIRPKVLLDMLKHARAGVPMEVMGLLLGEFPDEYRIDVVDTIEMPQSSTAC